jgi:hypothetical protein
MAQLYSALDGKLRAFIAEQKLFFTATAPDEGRVNVSPKGMDSFRVIDGNTVAYLDLTGSGNETAAHLRENGRITIMFCSFSAKPLILRLYGHGRVVSSRDAEWDDLIGLFPPYAGTRQIMVMKVESAQTSCGFAVPVYELVEERPMLLQWAERKGDDGLREYRHNKNRVSLDGVEHAGEFELP